MKKVVTNIQASIRDRLRNKAKEMNRSFAEILQYYGMERFLYRFSLSEYADQFVLKGRFYLLYGKSPIDARRLILTFGAL